VSFRQDSTLHATWTRKGHQPLIPVTGARKSIKIFGSVELRSARFLNQRAKVFNSETYINYLEHLARYYYPCRVYQIQNNASYHKKKEVWAWFNKNRSWWTAYNLPPYSLELNAAESMWHHVRIKGTHHRYFVDKHELLSTLTRVFRSIQRSPDQIAGYLKPFL
jgi:transposase